MADRIELILNHTHRNGTNITYERVSSGQMRLRLKNTLEYQGVIYTTPMVGEYRRYTGVTLTSTTAINLAPGAELVTDALPVSAAPSSGFVQSGELVDESDPTLWARTPMYPEGKSTRVMYGIQGS